MPELYAAATLTISRAGATTLAELACAGCPVLLLPYPHAADNHQLANARIYEAAAGALRVNHDRSPCDTSHPFSAPVAPFPHATPLPLPLHIHPPPPPPPQPP